jgi:hypothetical protein
MQIPGNFGTQIRPDVLLHLCVFLGNLSGELRNFMLWFEQSSPLTLNDLRLTCSDKSSEAFISTIKKLIRSGFVSVA